VRFHSNNAPVPVTLSCGVTTVRAHDTPETVFERADHALYDAKEAGRNRCAAR
jgi:diguanylate cyclase